MDTQLDPAVLLFCLTHMHTVIYNHRGFHGGMLMSRKCLFNNQLKVSQAASLQEECLHRGKRGRKIHRGGEKREIERKKESKKEEVGRKLES